ncbi:PhzF family phenazine biosynthesis protein [Phyllobacterium brassicacearum]|uniref:PhzF family phenazine biosynthesis protein n=1 Tax=Phyllobacterium brassicacearum TaxID=314235 RepID=A0A2P7B975_9HYPH|nr:PhzF family phenazine biosynthesis protein [Phyllobacterium brassicacearum]PSH63030.1 PhzF family phenazine biosynthesis protein [Phyllobacterium brassicacearum]TDQ14817.1 PhzF family phenazine biosynthesis protein [Phyllobacterium brassicacearum]
MANPISGMIDVFADTPLSGNPLAVVEGADHLEDDVLRLIAREFNQSETTFILKSDRADRRLRSFTASGAEVFGAGHNALGAWLWLGYDGQLGDLSTAQTFLQEIGDDILPITVESRDGRVHGRMKQASLQLSPPLNSLNSLAEALGLVADDLLSNPVPRAADTGASHLMVRLRDRQTVDRAAPSAEKLIEVLGPAGAEGCYLYAFETTDPENAYARFFNPAVGLWEDSATGTAAGPLCAYLGSMGLLTRDTLLIEQGTRMGRRSFLKVRLDPDPEISGSGVVVFRGTLHL